MHYNTFRLGREPMDEPLPRLLTAAERAGVRNRIHPLAEGQSWLGPEAKAGSQAPRKRIAQRIAG
jgi:hypothetical protein